MVKLQVQTFTPEQLLPTPGQFPRSGPLICSAPVIENRTTVGLPVHRVTTPAPSFAPDMKPATSTLAGKGWVRSSAVTSVVGSTELR